MPIRFQLAFCLLFLLVACGRDLQTAAIDATISKNPDFGKLDAKPEVFSLAETVDTSLRSSSNVIFTPTAYSQTKCRAFIENGVLKIDIAASDGYVVNGFIIGYQNQQFSVKPYYDTDVHELGEREPTFDITDQHLILDKLNYVVGDSIYGHIDLKMNFTDELGQTSPKLASGFFRAKIASARF